MPHKYPRVRASGEGRYRWRRCWRRRPRLQWMNQVLRWRMGSKQFSMARGGRQGMSDAGQVQSRCWSARAGQSGWRIPWVANTADPTPPRFPAIPSVNLGAQHRCSNKRCGYPQTTADIRRHPRISARQGGLGWTDWLADERVRRGKQDHAGGVCSQSDPAAIPLDHLGLGVVMPAAGVD